VSQAAARRLRSLSLESLESRAMLAVTPVASRPDLIAASDAGTSSTDNKTNVTTPTFEGTATNAASVRIFVGGIQAGTAPVVDGRWSFTHPGLASGRYSVAAQAVAADGGLGTRTAALPLEIRTAAPAAPTLGILQSTGRPTTTPAAATNQTRPTFSGLGPIGGTVEVLVDGVSAGRSVVRTNRAFSVRPAAVLAAGARSVTAVASDLFGNRSSPAALALTVDTEAPVAVSIVRNSFESLTVTFNEPVKGITPAAFLFAGRTMEGVNLAARPLTNPQVQSHMGRMIGTASSDGRSYTLRAPDIALAAGTYTITLSASRLVTDLAGNRLSSPVSLPITLRG